MIRPFPLHAPLPLRPRKPYISSRMTMAASFRCFNGVVMCADRLISHGRADQMPSFGHFESKVWHASAKGAGIHYGVMVAAAGDFPTAKVVADGVLRCAEDMHTNLSTTYPDARLALQKELDDAYARAVSNDELTLLVAVQQSPISFDVFRSDNLRVNEANTVELAGIGENSLTRFLTDSLFSELLSLEETAVLGALVIYWAKKYCPQYCGGRTDVWAMNEIGEIYGISEDEMNKLEVLFAKEGHNLLGILAKGKELIGLQF